MKIVKINEELLKEGDGKVDEISTDDSVKEIAGEIQDQAEIAGAPISDAAAKETAELAKDAGDAINADDLAIADDDAPLEIKNRLTDTLDQALNAAVKFKKRRINEVANVLVSGLPGSSKTASIYNWAARASANGEPVHITYLNAKNNDIQAFIDGYTVQDPDDKLAVRQAVSHNLDGLDQVNSVLFLDEYNRQTKTQIRASLLNLINEHYVTGRENGGRHYFPNFLFTIAAINPGGTDEDAGAVKLNDPEKTRYLFKVKNFDSDPEVTKDYLKSLYITKAQKEAAKKDPDWEAVEAYLRIWHIGTFLCDYEYDDQLYDGKNKLNILYLDDLTMLNQRTLTAALAVTDGDVDMLKSYFENSSDFLPENIEKLTNALESYYPPTFDQLLKAASIDARPANWGEEPKDGEQKQKPQVENPPVEDDEDDDDMWDNTPTTPSGKKILSGQEASKAILDDMDNW